MIISPFHAIVFKTLLLLKLYPNKFEDITSATFNVATYYEVDDDVKFLHEKMIHLNREEDFEYYGLAKHLLQRLEDLCIKDEEWNDLKLSSDMKSLEIIKSISNRSFEVVYESKWFGVLYAIKKMDVALNKFFKREVSILANLCHPNLITYYFALKDNVNKSGESFEIIVKKDYLYMEI
uniref:Protein kinase domain-containing protein n=1 Tax=Physcomitrium patens TaxID=3218 RepID=A0A2K1J1J3_PHYPA|nr:hypothetical protein PHYPA_023291 [Physcomitrium patens]